MAVEGSTDALLSRPSSLRKVIRICYHSSNLHRSDLPKLNQIGPLEWQEELRRMLQPN
jgi:hypothetical protein